MRALRRFHLPGGGSGPRREAYAEARLAITGLGALLFPPSPCRTVVRTARTTPSTDRAAPVAWLRSFGGRLFLPSMHTFLDGRVDDTDDGFHQVESMFPFAFTFEWAEAERPDRCVEPRHVATTLLGLVPVPLSLLGVNQRMAVHTDGMGWDLDVRVTALGGRINLIRYTGPMRLHDDDAYDGVGIATAAADNGGGGGGGGGAATTTPAAPDPPPLDILSVAAEVASSLPEPPSPPQTSTARYVDGFHDLVLFDGTCNLCNASVNFLIRRDTDRRLLFCTQQSPRARAVLRQLETDSSGLAAATLLPEVGVDTAGTSDTVLVLGADGVLRSQSDAALRAGEALGGGWRVLALASRIVPRPIRNVVYNYVGRNRYKWFGQQETCRIPTAEERRHFL